MKFREWWGKLSFIVSDHSCVESMATHPGWENMEVEHEQKW